MLETDQRPCGDSGLTIRTVRSPVGLRLISGWFLVCFLFVFGWSFFFSELEKEQKTDSASNIETQTDSGQCQREYIVVYELLPAIKSHSIVMCFMSVTLSHRISIKNNAYMCLPSVTPSCAYNAALLDTFCIRQLNIFIIIPSLFPYSSSLFNFFDHQTILLSVTCLIFLCSSLIDKHLSLFFCHSSIISQEEKNYF